MNQYTPELGKMAFGQPHEQYEISDAWECALRVLSGCIEEAHEHCNPADNSGSKFTAKSFHMNAYDWGEESDEPSFKWRDIEVRWYKYLGRGTTVSKEDLSARLAFEMLTECVAEISSGAAA